MLPSAMWHYTVWQNVMSCASILDKYAILETVMSLCFLRIQLIFWLAEGILADLEGPCSVELVKPQSISNSSKKIFLVHFMFTWLTNALVLWTLNIHCWAKSYIELHPQPWFSIMFVRFTFILSSSIWPNQLYYFLK